MSVTVKLDNDAMQALDAKLAELPMLYRNRALRASVKAIGKPIIKRWRQLIPNRPSVPGKKKGVFRKSLTSAVKEYQSNTVVLIVGPRHPQPPHTWWIETGGHEQYRPQMIWREGKAVKTRHEVEWVPTGKRVMPKGYGNTAAEQTQPQQFREMGKAAKKTIDQILAGN